MLVGGFCKAKKCEKMIEKNSVEGIFRICREQKSKSCQLLNGGCLVCGDYSDFSSLVIHHRNCDGDILEGEHRSNFHQRIVIGKRKIDDLTILCRKCHNDGFVTMCLNEPFLSDTNQNIFFNYYSPTFQKIGNASASFLCFDQRWQGTTLCLIAKQPAHIFWENGYLKCAANGKTCMMKIVGGKVRIIAVGK
jgi:hypothetical protein